MCFGRRDNIQEDIPASPARFAPEQPTYATAPPSYVPYQAPSTGPAASTVPAMAELGDDNVKPAAEAASAQTKTAAELETMNMSSDGRPKKDDKMEHDWERLVPDTSLFPPPPDLFSGWDRSPASNANEAEAEAGEQWCDQHPLMAPLGLDQQAVQAHVSNQIRLMAPQQGFRGDLTWSPPGMWAGRTEAGSGDACIIGYPPMYAATVDSPLQEGRAAKTIYYEVRVGEDRLGSGHVTLAVGYTALPYPSFRMPGWHRGSLAVHCDDGHRYINDRWGGKTFTSPVRAGQTVGIGMTFSRASPTGITVNVFFTRQGRLDGSWDLHEETDAQQDLPVTGLEGYHDLSCAIGTYERVDFKVILNPSDWLYKPVA